MATFWSIAGPYHNCTYLPQSSQMPCVWHPDFGIIHHQTRPQHNHLSSLQHYISPLQYYNSPLHHQVSPQHNHISHQQNHISPLHQQVSPLHHHVSPLHQHCQTVPNSLNGPSPISLQHNQPSAKSYCIQTLSGHNLHCVRNQTEGVPNALNGPSPALLQHNQPSANSYCIQNLTGHNLDCVRNQTEGVPNALNGPSPALLQHNQPSANSYCIQNLTGHNLDCVRNQTEGVPNALNGHSPASLQHDHPSAKSYCIQNLSGLKLDCATDQIEGLPNVADEAHVQKIDRKPIVASVNKTVKKKQHSEKWSQDSTQNFSHGWLLDQSDAILNMEFSANGKFLATCTDDDPDGTSGSSSSSEANKENTSPGRLTRRQKKNRVRKEDTSPLKKRSKRDMRKKGKHEEPFPLRQYIKLSLSDTEVFYTLKNYTLSAEDMMTLGYPVESKLYPGRALIFRPGALDANAKEFIPRDDSVYTSLLVQNSDPFDKKEDSMNKKRDGNGISSEEKKCVRCNKIFFMSSDNEYLTQEHCTYHWGKLHSPPSGGSECFYSCCKARQGTKGCTTAKLHVWTGVEPGTNGPFDGYVRTRQRKSPPQDGNYGIYSVDCEMCFTNTGLELTKISVVSIDGKPVYETFVRPESFIIDYNTRFSGITAKDMSKSSKVKTLKDVQNDLMGFITADTILVGHGLENDLRALRMIHYTVVDTAVVFPHVLGLPYKRSLKSLVHSYLRKDIQIGAHNSYEDACSCLELILWKLRKDMS